MRPKSMFSVALVLTALARPALTQEVRTYQEVMDAAIEAFRANDWPTLSAHPDAAQLLHPYSLFVTRNRILARAMEGRTEDALELAELDFLPEAYAPAEQVAYVGSVRNGTILAVDAAGEARVAARAPGGVFDLEVRGPRLWAVVNSQLAYEHADPESPWAAVQVFDVETGASLREVRVTHADALLGDLEVASDGVAYASDSRTPRIFRLAAEGTQLEIFATDPRFANLQGIALDEAHGRIFVADYMAGLFVVDLATGAVRSLEAPPHMHVGGIDGLVRFEADLIGIQNGTTPHRIVRIALDAPAERIVALEVLQQNLASWNEPPHGAVVGSHFHYIARATGRRTTMQVGCAKVLGSNRSAYSHCRSLHDDTRNRRSTPSPIPATCVTMPEE